jgi:hypothetical protein
MFPFIRELIGYGLQTVPYLMVLNKSGDSIYAEVLADFPEAEIDNLIQSLHYNVKFLNFCNVHSIFAHYFISLLSSHLNPHKIYASKNIVPEYK